MSLSRRVKCIEDRGFVQAEKVIKATLADLKLPEVAYFMDTYVPSMSLTLDELN